MGVFDFLKKKESDEDIDLDKELGGNLDADLGEDLGAPGPEPAFPEETRPQPAPPPQQQRAPFQQGMFAPPPPPPPQQFQQPQYYHPQQVDSSEIVKHQMEVVNTKIDSLRASVDRLTEKIEFIERYLVRR